MKGERRERGFTLVEMLIALAIFGMITAAGVTLLGLAARTQESADARLAEVGALRRLSALMTADLALATPRIHRDAAGAPQAAFAGASGEQSEALLLFARAGDEERGAARDGWRLRERRLERLAFARLDGAAPAVAIPVVDGVTSARLRYRDREGDWRDAWDPTDPTQLPRALALDLATDDHGEVRLLFLVAAGVR